MPRTDAYCRKVEAMLSKIPGIKYYSTVLGFSLLSQAQTTYNALFFVTLKPWDERRGKDEQAAAIRARINRALESMPEARSVSFPPPAIPGVGTAGGFNFILEDRVGKDPSFLTENLAAFMKEASKRRELSGLMTTYLPSVPQLFIKVDRDKVLKQGVDIGEVYMTLQTFLGGYFVNYFNRFGRQWQVYVEAEDKYRSSLDNLGLFYVRNRQGGSVPLSAVAKVERRDRPGVCHALQRVPLRPDQRRAPPRASVPTMRPAPWRMSLPRPCRWGWASTTSGCPSRNSRRPTACRAPPSLACRWCSSF